MSAHETVSPRLTDHLRVEEERLTVECVSCEELAEKYGTPLYVLSETRIRHNYRTFHGQLAKIYSHVLVCPAYKANSHLALCRIYQTEGAGAEVVSGPELKMALDAGVEPEKIVFNGPLKTRADLESAISSGVGLINADSLPELERMQEVARRVKRRCNVGIRINLGTRPETHPYLATALKQHKFGIGIEDAVTAYKEAATKSALNVAQPEIFREMATAMLQLASQVDQTLGLKLTKIDMGGGVGFPYQPDSRRMTFREYASAILTANMQMLERLERPTLIFEPGRAIVADAGLLLARVGVVKRQGDVNWAIVDAGMNTFIRPALYNAKHQVIAVSRVAEQAVMRYNLGGPCCESGDVIAKNVLLPELKGGDLLAVLDVGAYGFTMASNYNGQPRPGVVLVNNGQSHPIRRREHYEDLIAQELIPPHLRRV